MTDNQTPAGSGSIIKWRRSTDVYRSQVSLPCILTQLVYTSSFDFLP